MHTLEHPRDGSGIRDYLPPCLKALLETAPPITADLGKTGSAFVRLGRAWPLTGPFRGKVCKFLQVGGVASSERSRSAT